MRGVNKVIIIGHLGADPEVHQFANGSSVTNISVATSQQWKDGMGELKEITEWHRIQLFNRLGEIASQYLRKGSKVYIEGSLRTRKWIDDKGQDRYISEIRANNMQMLGGAIGNDDKQERQPIQATEHSRPFTKRSSSTPNSLANESTATIKLPKSTEVPFDDSDIPF